MARPNSSYIVLLHAITQCALANVTFCVMQQVTTNILFDLQAPMPWSLELTRAMVKVLWQCSQLLLRADLALAGHVNAVSQVRCAH